MIQYWRRVKICFKHDFMRNNAMHNLYEFSMCSLWCLFCIVCMVYHFIACMLTPVTLILSSLVIPLILGDRVEELLDEDEE